MASLEGMAVPEVEAMAATDLTELAMEDMEQVMAVEDMEQATSEAEAAEAAPLGHRQQGVGQATMIGAAGELPHVYTVGSMSRAKSSTRRSLKDPNTNTRGCQEVLLGSRRCATTSLAGAATASICSNGQSSTRKPLSR